ncbi:unnamed protein product [Hermetia illucens]|uniref:Venom dipeptidyl peptidase 4 n=1 Tax=Hermetia illucens TaxID=343691 RepID=A0A7R8UHY9_HERIL|nr:venom dipeptidyl peptidase 4 isoform X2 [Hermetia illucens]CAD7080974.1 unnamed protein product [Hermetia illucens]
MPNSQGASAESGKSNEELVQSKNRRKKLRIIIGTATTLVLVILLAVGIYLVIDGDSDGDSGSNNSGEKLDLESVLDGSLTALRFNGTIADGGILFKDAEGNLVEYDVATKKINRRLPKENPYNIISAIHEKSPDGRYILVAKVLAKLFRYSFLATYYAIDLETQIPFKIQINGIDVPLLYAKWGPHGNSLLVNFNGNLYYKASVRDNEIQLTNDDRHNVMNGHPDWVYEEEVFASNTAAWFNPSGTHIAYIRFDDSSTRSINLSYYGTPGDLSYQYPRESVVYYPKAGSNNPIVELYTVAVSDSTRTQRVPVPPALNLGEHLITAVTWLDNNNILSVFMNRVQNQASIQVSNATGRYELLGLSSSTGWIDLFTPPHRNEDGSKIALILPREQGGNAGAYRHLAILGTSKNSGDPTFLTNGKYVVQQVLYWDHGTNVIYYSANTEESSRALHIYGIRAEKGEKPHCLTCSIKINGVQQTYFSAEFDPSGKYVVINSLGPDVPQATLYEYSLTNNNLAMKRLLDWEPNKDIRDTISKLQLPKTSFHSIDLENGYTAQVMLLLPPNADLSGKTKYPMLVDVYGGPDSYSVVDRWSIDWGSYLASSHSVIYAKIDGRGSGLRGEKLLHSIYLKLGTGEIDDQIKTAKKLEETLPYIDKNRMGIWGWSYGGYAAAMALAKDDEGVFKCATSVAPVTDWAYYDSIYTERYMNVPTANPQGYENSRLTKIATNLNGKQYMLVHGTLDDNVHYQQAMVLAKVLEQNDIMFKQISYPDEDHGLSRVRPHLYHSLDKFFKECLKWE